MLVKNEWRQWMDFLTKHYIFNTGFMTITYYPA